MKKILTLIIPIFQLVNVQAQNIAYFQVDDDHIVLAENYPPNIELQCYSTLHGGKKMTEIVVNNNGTGKIVCKQNNVPAFILDRASATNPNGSNKIQQIPTREFHIKNIEREVIANQVYLTWNATIDEQSDIHFALEKINNDGKTEVIKQVGGYHIY